MVTDNNDVCVRDVVIQMQIVPFVIGAPAFNALYYFGVEPQFKFNRKGILTFFYFNVDISEGIKYHHVG